MTIGNPLYFIIIPVKQCKMYAKKVMTNLKCILIKKICFNFWRTLSVILLSVFVKKLKEANTALETWF